MKRITALLLALMMVLTLCPFAAFAEETEDEEPAAAEAPAEEAPEATEVPAEEEPAAPAEEAPAEEPGAAEKMPKEVSEDVSGEVPAYPWAELELNDAPVLEGRSCHSTDTFLAPCL